MKLSLRDLPYGKGVFADESIPANCRLLQFTGAIITFADFLQSAYTDDEDHIIQVGLTSFMAPSGGFDDFVNHSCDPNCWLEIKSESDVWLCTLREIAADEELTFDYSLTSFRDPYPWTMVCGCRSAKCRKHISNFELQPEEWQGEQFRRGVVPYYVAATLRGSARCAGSKS